MIRALAIAVFAASALSVLLPLVAGPAVASERKAEPRLVAQVLAGCWDAGLGDVVCFDGSYRFEAAASAASAGHGIYVIEQDRLQFIGRRGDDHWLWRVPAASCDVHVRSIDGIILSRCKTPDGEALAAIVLRHPASARIAAQRIRPVRSARQLRGCWSKLSDIADETPYGVIWEGLCFAAGGKLTIRSGWSNKVNDGEGLEEDWRYGLIANHLRIWWPGEPANLRLDCAATIEMNARLSFGACASDFVRISP